MDITRIDSDTLAIAKLVASAEGISLEEAIREELALWAEVNA
jgi:antitoxin component of RelBE/YafQ-DinJ toxin-antitoxin module